MAHTSFFFDLDGTITDSKQGIINSVLYSLNHFGIRASADSLLFFIGPPLKQSFARYFPGDSARVAVAVEKYREYFRRQGMFENQVYPGVPQMLERLIEQGHRIHLATSKPEVFARQILDHFQLSRYFSFVAGAELNGARNDKVDVLRYALQETGADVSHSLMVGDRFHDVVGGHAVGMKTVGVLYGYGSRQELESVHADYICQSMTDLQTTLLALGAEMRH